MERRKYQLLCTFATRDEYLPTARRIQSSYELPHKKIFIYENEKEKNEIIFTYNITQCFQNKFIENTILVHRNKNTNTVYTINALNFLICEINNGVLDKSFKINWENYRDILLLNNKSELKKIKIKLRDVLEINQN